MKHWHIYRVGFLERHDSAYRNLPALSQTTGGPVQTARAPPQLQSLWNLARRSWLEVFFIILASTFHQSPLVLHVTISHLFPKGVSTQRLNLLCHSLYSSNFKNPIRFNKIWWNISNTTSCNWYFHKCSFITRYSKFSNKLVATTVRMNGLTQVNKLTFGANNQLRYARK